MKQKPQDKKTPKITIENCQKQNCNFSTGECNNKEKCIYQSILTKGKIYCLKYIPLTKYIAGD